MSKYTTELRFICETNSGFPVDEISRHTPDEIINASREKIFNFSYPIYDIAHKPELERKILKHYYTREIGAETVGLWKLWLNEKLNLIMPKYNKLYEFEYEARNKLLANIDVTTGNLRTDNLLKTDDYKTVNSNVENKSGTKTDDIQSHTSTTDSENWQENSTASNHELNRFSDTPQGSATFLATESNEWLTDLRDITTSGSSQNTHTKTNTGTENKNTGIDSTTNEHITNNGTIDNTGTTANTGTQKHDGTEFGYRGDKTYSELISELNEKIINIDKLIVYELKDLFMQLW